MQEKLSNRLEQLKSEYESGQKQLEELEIRRTRLQETMLRISGAIQVLEEIQGETDTTPVQEKELVSGME